ncbi:MAG: ATP-grasp domain-containing protein [Desulfobacterales bacterium]|jgi:D-alanine-D-alanine ligase
MKRVLIITGAAGDAQGWGDLGVTETLRDALLAGGYEARIEFVRSLDDFKRALDTRTFDIVWSALYHIGAEADIVGQNLDEAAWLADILDRRRIPYIGPSARTMRQLIDKSWTHRILSNADIAVPNHHEVPAGQQLPEVAFPAFVKPSCESRSVGISDASVVHDRNQLARQVAEVHQRYRQPALIEAYLPGPEYTVLMLANGSGQEFLTGVVEVEACYYGKYPILRADMRGVGITRIAIPETRVQEAAELCRQAVGALNCLDHVRVDMRVDGQGKLRIIEVNGIPGLKPGKSWSPQIYSLYHPLAEGALAEYRQLVRRIVASSLERYGING